MRRRVLARGLLLGLLALLLLLALCEWTLDRPSEDFALPPAPAATREVPAPSERSNTPELPPLPPAEAPPHAVRTAGETPGGTRQEKKAAHAAPVSPKPLRPVLSHGRRLHSCLLDDERTLGPEETIVLERKLGPLGLERPHPRAHENPYFWTAFDLEEGVNRHGEPRYVARVPLSKGWDFYFIWQLGELRIGPYGDGRESRLCKIGRDEPALEAVENERKDRRTGEILKERYAFQTLELKSVTVPDETVALPSDPGLLRIRVRAATYLEGRLRGGKLFLFDDDTNAAFMDLCDLRRRSGNLSAGRGDSAVFVGSDRTVPNAFGTLLQTGGTYFVVTETSEEEGWIRVREYKGPMGRLAVRFGGMGGARLVHLVLVLKGGSDPGFVNLGETEGAVAVPAGRYDLVWGLAALGGAGVDHRHVEIWPGNFREVSVDEHGLASVQIGMRPEAELHLDVEGSMAELDPAGIEVKGLYGEEYGRFWGCPPILDYQVRDANGLLVEEGRFEMAAAAPDGEPSRDPLRDRLYPKSVVFTIPESARRPLRVSLRGTHPILGWIR